MVKKILKIAGIVIGAVIVLVIGYVAYVFLDFSRIEDNVSLDIYNVGRAF